MTTRASLIANLHLYQTTYSEERSYIAQFLALLRHPDAFLRSHLPGHITASAWIVDHHYDRVLLTHHAKLNRWLQPGGHADGDEYIARVAAREAHEETGLTTLQFVDEKIFDLDIHLIPARNDTPEHLHYDVRLLFNGSCDEDLVVTNESHELAWVNINDIGEITKNNLSILRMCSKTQELKSRVLR